MNSNPTGSRNAQMSSSVSLSHYHFDFGLPSSHSSSTLRSLNDQKRPHQTQTTPHSKPISSSSYHHSWSSTNKPSWTHQPTPAAVPKSMVGDIFGKSWTSPAPSGPAARHGIPQSDTNLFGDLLGSAVAQGKTRTNVPLKDAAPRNSPSMGNFGDSLGKTSKPTKNSTCDSAENLGNFSHAIDCNSKGGNFSGQAMKSGVSIDSNKDPFGSLAGSGSKMSSSVKVNVSHFSNSANGSTKGGNPLGSATKSRDPMNANKDPFGSLGDYGFKMNSSANKNSSAEDFENASKTEVLNSSLPAASINSNAPYSSSPGKMGSWVMPKDQEFSSQKPPPQSNGIDSLDALFSSTSVADGSANNAFSEVEDWELHSEFGGNYSGSTTELEGLPPPPAALTASLAKNKGMDNYKQGQYADAIKWLSWAEGLLEKTRDYAPTAEVLSCRASCYKEVGEYKKAIADCSKVLEHDSKYVSVLLQRALLYESSEKYKLGAEDMRTVLKIDPSNRLAKSTIHRLAKMAD